MTSIGELNERSLHRALKERYAVAGSETEQVIDGFVTDVVAGGRIIEIQTGSFGLLRNKLTRLLDAHLVTLVHPIARDGTSSGWRTTLPCRRRGAGRRSTARCSTSSLRWSASRRCSHTPTSPWRS